MDELITPGGELAFVSAMVRDSVKLRDRVGGSGSVRILEHAFGSLHEHIVIRNLIITDVEVPWPLFRLVG